jgi:hypothetical protein
MHIQHAIWAEVGIAKRELKAHCSSAHDKRRFMSPPERAERLVGLISSYPIKSTGTLNNAGYANEVVKFTRP